jgi:hypothetical protein
MASCYLSKRASPMLQQTLNNSSKLAPSHIPSLAAPVRFFRTPKPKSQERPATQPKIKSTNRSIRNQSRQSPSLTIQPAKSPIHLIRWPTHHPITGNQTRFLHINPFQQIPRTETPYILSPKWATRPSFPETPTLARSAASRHTASLALGRASGTGPTFGSDDTDGAWWRGRHGYYGRSFASRA